MGGDGARGTPMGMGRGGRHTVPSRRIPPRGLSHYGKHGHLKRMPLRVQQNTHGYSALLGERWDGGRRGARHTNGHGKGWEAYLVTESHLGGLATMGNTGV